MIATDHPRECGANVEFARGHHCHAGSSPRVRGKQAIHTSSSSHLRIIPASAGQTSTRRSSARSAADHPRECGANVEGLPAAYPLIGSSPRVRGKLPIDLVTITADRIIPASAGQTSSSVAIPAPSPDHPRECGANAADLYNSRNARGSSPRVRGKLLRIAGVFPGGRIIPASAGQTLMSAVLVPNFTDHPRECGANSPGAAPVPSSTGSSPRVRGKHMLVEPVCSTARIIPASAGQTLWNAGASIISGGSSPRVRGKPLGYNDKRQSDRIIPASAGQTHTRVRSRPDSTDHPRECGANEHVEGGLHVVSGSSPRVRGKRFQLALVFQRLRIIPASAGQT